VFVNNPTEVFAKVVHCKKGFLFFVFLVCVDIGKIEVPGLG
jgi:hypothetical protein